MKIEKKTELILKTTSGGVIREGDTLMFEAYGKCLIGKYKGIGKRGALLFENPMNKQDMNVSPNSIGKIEFFANALGLE